MIEHIKCPNIDKKQIAKINWFVKTGAVVKEKTKICSLTLEYQDNSLLKHILAQAISKNQNVFVQSTISGTVQRLFTIEEIQETGVICAIRMENEPDSDSACAHEIEFGGICGKCGQSLEA
jgi:hypothetical protein